MPSHLSLLASARILCLPAFALSVVPCCTSLSTTRHPGFLTLLSFSAYPDAAHGTQTDNPTYMFSELVSPRDGLQLLAGVCVQACHAVR